MTIPILIDDRERLPWTFPGERFTESAARLRTGDYSLAGLQDVVVIERKSLGDAVNTVMHDWIRFRKELYRLAGCECAIIAIEASPVDVIAHRYDSDANPNSVLGRINGITLDHGLPVMWWSSRQVAIELAARFLALAWKKYGDRSLASD